MGIDVFHPPSSRTHRWPAQRVSAARMPNVSGFRWQAVKPPGFATKGATADHPSQ